MQRINEKLRFKCGIYEIFNLENGKRYVGSSKDLYNRLHEHLHNLNNNKAHNKHFQYSWNKHGEDSFIYGILEYCDEEVRFDREQHYINSLEPEYNLTLNVVANFGHTQSEECKKKISETLKKKYASGEISTYRQDHAWVSCHIYDIETFTYVGYCKCLKEASKLLNIAKISGSNKFNIVYKEKYILHPVKFKDMNELVNYACEKFITSTSKYGKYRIIKDTNGKITYCRNLQHAAILSGSSKSTLSKHLDATEDNPYIIKKSNYMFYYTNNFVPITGLEAVPIEESSESLSGNIGESPTLEDNTEISSEIKESEPSYSIGNEPLD